MIDIFANPESFFILLLAVPAVYFSVRFRKGQSFTSETVLKKLPVSLRQRLFFLPTVFIAASFVLMVIALARPQNILEQSYNITEGMAIEMVIDRSSSMSYEMKLEDEWKSRLDIVKEVFSEFITGNDKIMGGRPNDLIGLILFAGFPETALPLSLHHTALVDYLPYIQVVSSRFEDGTAIGDAVLLAAGRLKDYEANLEYDAGYKIKNRIIILLTDGNNNAGKISPLDAAEIAGKWGIKIYTIGFSGEETSRVVNNLSQTFRQMVPSKINEEYLRRMAELSGGKYFGAENGNELRNIYEEIDRLEKSRIKVEEYNEIEELYFPFAFSAGICFIIYIILSTLIFRRLSA